MLTWKAFSHHLWIDRESPFGPQRACNHGEWCAVHPLPDSVTFKPACRSGGRGRHLAGTLFSLGQGVCRGAGRSGGGIPVKEGWWALCLVRGLWVALASSPVCVRTGSGHGAVGRRDARASFRKDRSPPVRWGLGRRVFLGSPVPCQPPRWGGPLGGRRGPGGPGPLSWCAWVLLCISSSC